MFNKIVLMSNAVWYCFLHVYKWFCFSISCFSQYPRGMIRQSVDYSHHSFRRGRGVVGVHLKSIGWYWEGCGYFAHDACQEKRFRVTSGSFCVSYEAGVMEVSHMIQHPVEGMAH